MLKNGSGVYEHRKFTCKAVHMKEKSRNGIFICKDVYWDLSHKSRGESANRGYLFVKLITVIYLSSKIK